MGRIIGIDYGGKRVGIAVTDTMGLIANPLNTVIRDECLDFLKEYVRQEPVEEIVVGMPRDLSNRETHATAMVEEFIEVLKKTFEGVEIKSVDERYTSKIAKEAMIIAGLGKNKRKDKNLVDKTSASLILQTYLEMKQ